MDRTKYSEILLNGFDLSNSYVLLDRQPGSGIHLAFKPTVERPEPDKLMVGGKARVAFDATYGISSERKIILLDRKDQINALLTAYTTTNLKWGAVDCKRCSASVGTIFNVSPRHEQKFINNFNFEDYVNTLLQSLRSLFNCDTFIYDKDIKEFLLESYKDSCVKLFNKKITKPPLDKSKKADVIDFNKYREKINARKTSAGEQAV